jgi:hypothetical protein
MEQKEALRFIEQRLNEGISRQAIYKELLGKVPYKDDLLSYMSIFPDMADRKQYANFNGALVATLVLIIVIKMISMWVIVHHLKAEHIPGLVLGGAFTTFLLPFMLVFVVREAWRFRVTAYMIVPPLALLDLGYNAESLGQINSFAGFLILMLFIVPWFVSIFLAIFIRRKAFRYQGFLRVDKKLLEQDLAQGN